MCDEVNWDVIVAGRYTIQKGVFFLVFLMEPGWQSSLRQISTSLTILFQGTGKTVASRYKCGHPPQKQQISVAFRPMFIQKQGICDRLLGFQEWVWLSLLFRTFLHFLFSCFLYSSFS
jgi:hypothetical protein